MLNISVNPFLIPMVLENLGSDASFSFLGQFSLAPLALLIMLVVTAILNLE
jgi:hypothetical protein